MKRVIIPVVAFVAMVAAMLLNACTEPLTDTATPEVAQTEANAPAPIEFSPEELSLVEQIANNSPKISQESAQQTAMQLLGLQGDAAEVNSTPAKPLLASTVFCNRKTVYNGISKSYETENDTAFYVFNTPDDNGFAIVAADLRVPNQVLAYADHGNFDPESDNPGVAYFLELAQDYVSDCIEKAEIQKDSLTESVCRKLGIEIDTNTQKTLSKYSINRIKCTYAEAPTVTITNLGGVEQMIDTEWGQGTPYNVVSGVSNVGCAVVAVSQLMAFWRSPDVIVFNGYRLNWDAICNEYATNHDEQVSTLMAYVRTQLKTHGSSTNPHRVLRFLRNIHYSSQNQLYDYKYYKVTDALDLGMPVWMRGESSKKNHEWIADGYLERRVVKHEVFKYCIVEQFDNGTVTTRYEDIPSNTDKTYTLLHLNWGWDGRGNGYYSQNVFDTNYEMKEDREGFFNPTISNTSNRHKYNKNLEIITDIKPRY